MREFFKGWRRKAGCGLLLIVVLVLATAAIHFRAAQLAAADLDSLLAGNGSAGIEALEVTLQQRRIFCHDRIVLNEIAAILRKPNTTEGYYGGTAYEFDFKFPSGRSYTVRGEVGEDSFALTVPSARPVEGWWPTHSFEIPRQASQGLTTIFVFLNARWEEVGGVSLTLNENHTMTYAYDPELHGGNPRGNRVAELTGVP